VAPPSAAGSAAGAAEGPPGARATGWPAPGSTPEGCQQLAGQLREREDRLHVLVNNAGAAWGERLDDYPVAGFDKVTNLNLRAPFLLTQALLEPLRAAASADDPARVINIGSIDGHGVPMLETYAYSASKAGLHHLTRHLGARLAADHITVNAIAPGLFPSKMTAFVFEREDEVVAGIPLGRAGTPEDVAGIAIHLASRAGAYVTGAVIPVDGGAVTLR
jgi:NAD(P)-dependent dehydrogenase (short-subunit alcohol dehydrogenase family)